MDVVTGLRMAKKKAAPKKPDGTTRAFRMSNAYAEWLRKAAVRDRSSVAAFLDRAAAFYARSIGVEEEPPAR